MGLVGVWRITSHSIMIFATAEYALMNALPAMTAIVITALSATPELKEQILTHPNPHVFVNNIGLEPQMIVNSVTIHVLNVMAR